MARIVNPRQQHQQIKTWITGKLPLWESELISEIFESGTYIDLPAETEVLRKGQYVKSIPVLLEGLEIL